MKTFADIKRKLEEEKNKIEELMANHATQSAFQELQKLDQELTEINSKLNLLTEEWEALIA